MESLRLYFRELHYLQNYIMFILIMTVLSYSVYFFFDQATVASLGDEDHFFEWMTSLSFLFCSIIFLYLAAKKRNIILLLMAAAFFVGFGEEISWGQRILGFETPESLYAINMQKEFNFHNIMTWEINFVFKLFTLCFGILLPFCVFHFRGVSNLARRMRIPVPPVTLGIFFLADWIVFRLFIQFVLVEGATPKYYFACTEIYEFITSLVLLVISIFFLVHRRLIAEGTDIKEHLESDATRESIPLIPVKYLNRLFSWIF